MARLLSLALAGSLLPGVAVAQDAPADAVVGVFAPRVFFQNSLARTGYADEVAARLSEKTGLRLSGRGFATRGDFEQQVKQGRVQFAVVEAQLQAERGFPALASGKAGGSSRKPMVLVVAPGTPASIGALKGRSLARVSVGSKDAGFVTGFLLQGQVAPDWFRTTKARDVQAALSLVKVGKADAAFTFAGSTAGLQVAFQSQPVPLPVFVQTDRGLAPEVVSKVRGAIGAVQAANPVFSGFGSYDAAGIEAMGGGLSASRRPGARPILAPPRSTLPPVTVFIERDALPMRLPPASEGITPPPPPGDRF